MKSGWRASTAWLISGSLVALLVIAWFGYRANREWRRTSGMLAHGRAEDTADLLLRTLARDMRGVDEQILSRLHWDELAFDEPYEIRDLVASAFARYPYPEAFFGWDGDGGSAGVTLFTRVDRQPRWLPSVEASTSFPVQVVRESAAAAHLPARMASLAAEGRRFAAFETSIDGQPYQVVARLLYRDARRMRLERVFGFVVNLAWARSTYFPELTGEVARLTAGSSGLRVAILDDTRRVVAGTVAREPASPIVTRALRPLFFDPELVLLSAGGDLPTAAWTVQVDAADDPTLALAVRGTEWTLGITTLAAMAFGMGLWLTARAIRASTELARLRGDFVSSVTHELKTPLATIMSAAEALVRGRVAGPTQVTEYAQLLDQEAKRLGRLVNNLLAYSRITDVHEAYTFEPLAPVELLEDLLRGFQPQFCQLGFEVHTDLPADLPPIRGDATALAMAFDNVIDNALRYSTTRRWLAVSARRHGPLVMVDVRDRGIGIAADELGRVERRFVRGRQTRTSGSGLGLAIAGRVVRDHGGTFTIESTVDEGTTVHIGLPVLE